MNGTIWPSAMPTGDSASVAVESNAPGIGSDCRPAGNEVRSAGRTFWYSSGLPAEKSIV